MAKNIIEMPDIDHVPDAKGLGFVYYHSMSRNFNKLAQVDGLTGEKDTYGQLLNRAVRVALHMKDMGVKPGDIVCTCSFNHLNAAVPLIASMFIGAISTSIHPNACVNDLEYLFKLLKPKVIFVQSGGVDKIKHSLSLIDFHTSMVVFDSPSEAKLLRCHQDEAKFLPRIVNSLEDTAFIVIKNNSTGYPKAVCYNHYTFLCYVMNKKYVSDESLSLCLYYASPSWSVFIANVNMSIIRGGARLIYPRYDPTKAWEMFDHEVTFAFITVLQLANMCKQGVPKNLNADSLRYLEVGGDFAQKYQVLELKKMFPNTTVRLVYGLTEILTIFEASDPKDSKILSEKPMSVGTGVPGYSYKV
ncbi:hypothetical protein FQR65_LT12957 [Abscondita terminalis]|nr:hypothetical protein FQR65_LT12957 [Abscondita terminalis]